MKLESNIVTLGEGSLHRERHRVCTNAASVRSILGGSAGLLLRLSN
jgi:hypothetical protein